MSAKELKCEFPECSRDAIADYNGNLCVQHLDWKPRAPMTASSRKEEGLTAALRRAIQAIEVCRAMSSTTPTGRERANRDIEEIERLIAGNTTPPPAAHCPGDGCPGCAGCRQEGASDCERVQTPPAAAAERGEVKRWRTTIYDRIGDGRSVEVVKATDFDALTLENEALKRKLANSSYREQELYLTGLAAANRADDNERKLAAAQSELDAARRDAERYRYWRQHQYNGLLDVDEFCDANSPQAIHFDRITDEAIKAALSPPPREGV